MGKPFVIEPADLRLFTFPIRPLARVWRAHRNSGPAGIGIQACSLTARELRLASALESGLFGGFGWGWGTGDTTGIITESSSTTAAYLSRSRVFRQPQQLQSRRLDFMVAALPRGRGFASSGPRVRAGTHSSAFSGFNHGGVARASLLAGSRASGEAFMVEVSEVEVFHGGGGGRRLSRTNLLRTETDDMEEELMRTDNMKIETFTVRVAWGFASTVVFLLVVGLLLLVAGLAGSSFAQDLQPKNVLVSCGSQRRSLFRLHKRKMGRPWKAILGAGKGSHFVERRSGGQARTRAVQPKNTRRMHRLVQELDGTTVLYIGAENWPFPIPLFSKNGAWFFDSKTGAQENVVPKNWRE